MDTLVSLAVMVAGAGLFMFRLRGARAAVAPGPANAAEVGRVTIIVPARDEAHNLPTLLESLRALEPAPLEIIVVDDHSTDGTGDIARAYGARVVTPPPMPAGWIGKSWACWAGANHASGDFLLFTDADTWHAPTSLASSMASLLAADAGLVSVIPTHRVVAPWERLQGVFQLLLLVATRAFSERVTAGSERHFAIGQYLLFRRSVYDAVGGHEAIAHRLAEDLALGRLVADAGARVRVLFAPRALQVRMYPEGLGAFVSGWRRSFRDGIGSAGGLAVLELGLVIGWLLGIPLWMAQAVGAGHGAWGALWAAAYLGTAWLVAREQRNYGAFPGWTALAYPCFVFLFVLVSALSAFDSVRGAQVTWRGRRIELGMVSEGAKDRAQLKCRCV